MGITVRDVRPRQNDRASQARIGGVRDLRALQREDIATFACRPSRENPRIVLQRDDCPAPGPAVAGRGAAETLFITSNRNFAPV